MSLPQPHQSQPASEDSEGDQSPSLVRYNSLQGALGGRRVSHPVPLTYRSLPDIPSSAQHIPAESRYIYSSASSSVSQNQSYPYEQQQQYPPSSSSSYETSQYSHNSLPRMRTSHSYPDSSRSAQAPPGYGVPYVAYPPAQQPPHYAVSSGMHAASWPAAYTPYPGTSTDASSLSPSSLVRNEAMAPHTPLASGAYRAPAGGYPAPAEEGSKSSSGSSRIPSASDPKGKHREVKSPTPRSRVSEAIDFHKLSSTYRHILDNASQSPPPAGTLSHPVPSGLPASQVLDRIYDFAVQGVRQFDPSDRDSQPRPTTPAAARPAISPKGEGGGKGTPKRQRSDAAAATTDSQRCMGCGATSTPEWRRGPLGPRTLCNACGLVYAKLIKKRGREAAGRSIMEGTAVYAIHEAGTVPGELVQDFGLSAGEPSGLHDPHRLQQDDEGRGRLSASVTGEGSEDDGSYEEHGGRSGHGSSARGPVLE